MGSVPPDIGTVLLVHLSLSLVHLTMPRRLHTKSRLVHGGALRMLISLSFAASLWTFWASSLLASRAVVETLSSFAKWSELNPNSSADL